MAQQIIIATGNEGKMREFREILSDLPLMLTSLRDHWDPVPEIEENGSSFLENATIKADWVFDRTGIWALADDSGLEVDALEGGPGVKSARYAGEGAGAQANNEKLLKVLEGVPVAERSARFRCVLVLKTGKGIYHSYEGTCEGTIDIAAHGTYGFGYDPLFIPAGYDRSFAELGQKEKHAISHRGNALRRLREYLYESV